MHEEPPHILEDRPFRPAPAPPPGMINRIPPQDLDAERAVLGSILLDREAVQTAIGEVEPDDFYKPSHQVLLRAMYEITRRKEPVDTITLSSYLRSRGELEAAGGLAAIVGLASAVPTAANLKYYAEIVRRKSILRKLIAAATGIVGKAFESPDADQVIDEAERAIFEVCQAKAKQGVVQVNSIVGEVFKRIEKLAAEKRRITGVPTGLNELDEYTAGLQPSDLIIVAGRPAMGKTSFALGLGMHAALYAKAPVVVFSLEMSKEQLVTRMLSSDGRIDSKRMKLGLLAEEDWPKLARAAGRVSEAPVFIDDTAGTTVLEVRAKCRRVAAEHGLGLVIIDYIQLMKGSANTQSREQEISEISRNLKGLAKELNVPIIALSQLNRSLENRPEKRPVLSDLRESGAIEQDADIVMFVYRDEVYNPETPDRGIAEIIIGKHRSGSIGRVRCRFFAEYTRFENLLEEDVPVQA